MNKDNQDNYHNHVINVFNGNDMNHIVVMLDILSDRPTGNKKILARLQQLLLDKRPCIVYRPTHYSELRYAVGSALGAELRVYDKNEIVMLKNVVRPINFSDIIKIAKENDIDYRKKPIEEILSILIDLGHVPTITKFY